MGRIRRPHGVRGELLVEVLSDRPERFAPGSELLLSRPGSTPGAPPVIEGRVRVEAARKHRDALLVHLAGIADRDAAEALRDSYLEAEIAPDEPPPEGGYFHYQLHGCRCRDRHHGDLGEVVDVVEDGGGLLLILQSGDRLLPVPFVASFLVSVDVEAKRIELDLPPGLVESCTSGS